MALLSASPVLAWQLPEGSVQPSPSDCISSYAGGVATGGSSATYTAGAAITCYRPGNTASYGGGQASTTADGVPDGTPCQVIAAQPITFQDQATSIHATWSSPDGAHSSASIAPDSYGSILSASGGAAGTNDILALYERDGTYQGGSCQATGPWQDYCQMGNAAAMPTTDPCIRAVPHIITPASSPPPPSGPYLANVIGSLKTQAGTIHSLPSPNGLVNLPTCFWLDGIGVPNERDTTLTLPGPPDSTNRRIYYTYLVRVFFAGVDWNFDDPYGSAETAPAPACGQHPQLTAHSYEMISEKHSADGYYHITATEKYQVTVDMYWTDSYGSHHQPVDPGVALPITVSPPGPYNQYVGQIEGIPISS